MKNLVYYPTFEPKDLKWLKFALIYFDQFSPIIPVSGYGSLSEIFRTINAETDLIEILEPKWQQGDNAATKALKEIEFITTHPEQYRDKFNDVNILRTWQNPHNWRFKLYEEKFTTVFKHECIDRHFGVEIDGGLLTSRELAHFFMTFLVEEIAFEKGGNPITDLKELDNLSSYLRTRNPINEKLIETAQTVINITLPDKIENIDIDKFIQFRNGSGMKELRTSFSSSLNSFYESLEEDFNVDIYLNHLKKSNAELAKEIGLFFGGIVSTSLGGLVLIQNPNNLEMIEQILEGTIMVTSGGFGMNKAWTEGKEKRHARKFLSNIHKIRK